MPYGPCNGDIPQSPVELLPTFATLSGCLLPLRALLRIEQRYVGQSTAWLHSVLWAVEVAKKSSWSYGIHPPVYLDRWSSDFSIKQCQMIFEAIGKKRNGDTPLVYPWPPAAAAEAPLPLVPASVVEV